MRFYVFFFLVLLGFLYLSLGQGSYEDCCLRHVNSVKKHTIKNVVSYRKQELDGGCNIAAIVFKTKRGRFFCANPKDKWVQKLLEKVDRENESVHGKKYVVTKRSS
ncbi:C-C motif chemokine 25 [Pygocentrus nattereri]|uniref:C-C motif chemokine 25 n=1 Tax=Pygocentrus nattereri TaxID=42514 RepID=UPI00081487EC|nr:C-C motif chemokine 25 [Pygocentrus nattereri]